jgi:hypothetical protein
MKERSDEIEITSTTLLAAAEYHQRKCSLYGSMADNNRRAFERRQLDQSLTKPENIEVTEQCRASSDKHTRWAEWHRAVWYACENAANEIIRRGDKPSPE